jgi:hypothetical protein
MRIEVGVLIGLIYLVTNLSPQEDGQLFLLASCTPFSHTEQYIVTLLPTPLPHHLVLLLKAQYRLHYCTDQLFGESRH